jgi:hypothetical protein
MFHTNQSGTAEAMAFVSGRNAGTEAFLFESFQAMILFNLREEIER